MFLPVPTSQFVTLSIKGISSLQIKIPMVTDIQILVGNVMTTRYIRLIVLDSNPERIIRRLKPVKDLVTGCVASPSPSGGIKYAVANIMT
jgi:hypothetical protein